MDDWVWIAGCIWLGGCLPSRFNGEGGDGGGDGGTTEASATGGPGGSSPTGSSDTASATTGLPTRGSTGAAESSSSTGFYDPTSFLVDPDFGGGIGCSVWDQNCPPGEKCMPWANDGGNSWNASRCSAIAPDPDQVDDPCTVEGSGVSGVDSCDFGLMCFDVDTDTNEGTCWPLCIGSENAPLCADPDRVCSLGADGVVILCVARCDPLAQDCAPGQACYQLGNNFLCAPDVSGDDGAFGDACEFVNVCDPGLVCVWADAVPGCAAAQCCTPFCDLSSADDCPDAQMECLPAIGDNDPLPGLEHVGICVLPED